ncbi:MAG: metal ABC transporter permease [Acidobacteria bacterium]|nr:metal ABC transporter permease [Acidobacteriota bacterium]
MSALSLLWPALVAGMLVGAAAPAIGTFVVQKRLSLVGDGLGHIAFAGVAIGLWLGISPLAGALAVAALGGVGIDALRRRNPEEADMVLALFFYGSIATAVVVASLSGTFNVNLFGFLFGQVLTVTPAEMAAIGALALVILAGVAGLYRGLVAAAIDEEAAAVGGLPVRALNVGLMVLAGLTIAVGMQVVGILLVAAMMVIPVGVARNLVRSFRSTLVAASAVGAASAVAGIGIAWRADSAPSGTIVLVAVAAYALASGVRRARGALARRRAGEAA